MEVRLQIGIAPSSSPPLFNQEQWFQPNVPRSLRPGLHEPQLLQRLWSSMQGCKRGGFQPALLGTLQVCFIPLIVFKIRWGNELGEDAGVYGAHKLHIHLAGALRPFQPLWFPGKQSGCSISSTCQYTWWQGAVVRARALPVSPGGGV